jgi:hypothetical protein
VGKIQNLSIPRNLLIINTKTDDKPMKSRPAISWFFFGVALFGQMSTTEKLRSVKSASAEE